MRVGGKLYLKEGHLWRTSMAGRVGIYPVTTGSNKLVCSTHTGLHSGNRICSFLVTQSVIFACHVENLHLNRLNWEDCRRVARLQFWTPAPHCCIIFQTSPPSPCYRSATVPGMSPEIWTAVHRAEPKRAKTYKCMQSLYHLGVYGPFPFSLLSEISVNAILTYNNPLVCTLRVCSTGHLR